MTAKTGDSPTLLTRRDLLRRTAQGVAALSVAPWVGHAESVLAADPVGEVAPRSRETFDFGWRFTRGDPKGAHLPEFADTDWSEVDLPHDWSIEGPCSQVEPSSGPGGYLPTGIGWYRKRLTLQPSDRGRVVTLEFDGIYENSEVWMNGHSLGVRPYGFIPFTYELTSYLRFDGDNVVAVRVDNSRQTNCRWYSGSGIHRHTWVVRTQPVRIACWGTFASCPEVSTDRARVRVETRVANGAGGSSACTLATTLLDGSGLAVANLESQHAIVSREEFLFTQEFTVSQPLLWSVETPHLYTVRSTLREGDRVVDRCDTTMGIRSAVFDVNRGFLLNGEPVKIKGVCLHPEAGCVGAAVPERVWERRLEELRAMGCNAIRTSHNPFAAEFLDLCDRMGFLVMNEAFDEWRVPKAQIQNGYHLYFDEWHERDLRNFIRRDRNHPSVVLWSAGNEVPDQSAPDGAARLRSLREIFRSEDPTRPVTVGCDQIASEPTANRVRPEFLAELDVVGYNYVDRWRNRADLYYSIDRAAFPERRFIGTESVGMGGIRGDYRGLVAQKDDDAAPWFAQPANLRIDAEQLWQFIALHDYVAGDFVWTGIDYLGESRWPMRGAPSGVLDTCGFRKDSFYFYQSQWTTKPMLHLFPHWNWKGSEGAVIPVTCYTNCDTVELFLNGRSLGVKGYEFPRLGMEGQYGTYPARARVVRTTADLHLSWDVPYGAGTLRAVGTRKGDEAVVEEISTTGEAATIRLRADRASIAADRRDVVHLIVSIEDAQGRVVPGADNEVHFAIEGEGHLIGVDNGDLFSQESYKVARRRAFHGLCLAIVQSSARPGQIEVAASSPGLRGTTVVVRTNSITL